MMASSSGSALLRRTLFAAPRTLSTPSVSSATRVAACRHNSTSTSSSSSSSTSSSSSYTKPIPQLSDYWTTQTPRSRIKPAEDTFYSAKPAYLSLVLRLQSLLDSSRRALEKADVLPRDAKPPTVEEAAQYEAEAGIESPVLRGNPWKKRGDLSEELGLTLSASQYRHVTSSLTLLSRYHGLVRLHLAGGMEGSTSSAPHLGEASIVDRGARLAAQIESTLDDYRRDLGNNQGRGDGFTTKTGVDEKGRIWGVGGRKDSSARVWIAPVTTDEAVGDILINGSPLSSYFTRQTHRESVVHSLRLSGLVGQFNIFALTNGGGHSGQAGAIAHGLAKALVRFFEGKVAATSAEDEPEKREEWDRLRAAVRATLAKDGVYKRDPRMVERKKTGLAKARKAYTWVKR